MDIKCIDDKEHIYGGVLRCFKGVSKSYISDASFNEAMIEFLARTRKDRMDDVHMGELVETSCSTTPVDHSLFVDLSHIAVQWKDLIYDRETMNLVGTFKVLKTPRGNELQTLIDNGFINRVIVSYVGITLENGMMDISKIILMTLPGNVEEKDLSDNQTNRIIDADY